MAKEADKKIIDVKAPGRTPAEPTSKAVIVKNRSMVKDPMMAAASPKSDGLDEAETPAGVSPKKIIESLKSKAESAKSKEATLPLDKEGVKVKQEAAPAAADKPAEEPTKPAETKEQPAETKEQPVEAPPPEAKPAEEAEPATQPSETDGDPAATDQKAKAEEEKKAAAAEAERAAAVEKLVTSQQYYLPINKVEKRRARKVSLIGIVLAIVLALAWVDISLDSGLIKIPGVKAPTHFFSN